VSRFAVLLSCFSHCGAIAASLFTKSFFPAVDLSSRGYRRYAWIYIFLPPFFDCRPCRSAIIVIFLDSPLPPLSFIPLSLPSLFLALRCHCHMPRSHRSPLLFLLADRTYFCPQWNLLIMSLSLSLKIRLSEPF
jgi:hypothetical protein